MVDLIPARRRRREDRFPTLFREMEDMMKTFWGDTGFGELATSPGLDWAPRVDVSETDKTIEVKAELPGLEKKDVTISLDRDTLIIKGEKKQEKEEKTKTFHRTERSYGTFYRALRLPTEVEADKVEAAYEKGVLTVTLPKTEESKKRVRQIDIR